MNRKSKENEKNVYCFGEKNVSKEWWKSSRKNGVKNESITEIMRQKELTGRDTGRWTHISLERR